MDAFEDGIDRYGNEYTSPCVCFRSVVLSEKMV